MKFPPLNEDSTLHIMRENLSNPLEYERRLLQKYGDAYQFKLFGRLFYSIANPDCLKHILHDNIQNYHRPTRGAFSHEKFVDYCGNSNNLRHTVDQEYWQKSGNAVVPAFFSKERFEKYTPVMAESALRMAETWEDNIKNNTPIDIKSDVMILASRNVLFNLFDDINVDFERFFIEKTKVFAQIGKRGFGPPILRLLHSFQDHKDWQEGKKYIQELTQQLIEERLAQNQPQHHNDILGGLIDAFKVESDNQKFMADLNSEFRMYLVTGETLASGLNHTLALLSQHAQVERKVQEELNAVLKGELPTYESVNQLTYLMCVVKEVLRFRSPAPQVTRIAVEADEMMGYSVPKSTMLILRQFWTHHHPDYWDNPESFDPERFRDKPWGQNHEYAYVPFSGGPRGCIGAKFSLHFFVTTLATLLQCYRFKLLPGTNPVPQGSVLSFPVGADQMVIEKRSY